jgi:hypothetical protein
MPNEDGFGLNDHQRLFPVRPDGSKEDPQQPVWIPEFGLLEVPVQNHELVAEHQVFEQELGCVWRAASTD